LTIQGSLPRHLFRGRRFELDHQFSGHAFTGITGGVGDAAAARDQLAALLPVHERVLGPEHPLTLAGRINLARWTWEAGDATSARDEYAALLPVIERLLGPEHRHTLAARRDLARWTRRADSDQN
jgi:hypothetical protein